MTMEKWIRQVVMIWVIKIIKDLYWIVGYFWLGNNYLMIKMGIIKFFFSNAAINDVREQQFEIFDRC